MSTWQIGSNQDRTLLCTGEEGRAGQQLEEQHELEVQYKRLRQPGALLSLKMIRFLEYSNFSICIVKHMFRLLQSNYDMFPILRSKNKFKFVVLIFNHPSWYLIWCLQHSKWGNKGKNDLDSTPKVAEGGIAGIRETGQNCLRCRRML